MPVRLVPLPSGCSPRKTDILAATKMKRQESNPQTTVNARGHAECGEKQMTSFVPGRRSRWTPVIESREGNFLLFAEYKH